MPQVLPAPVTRRLPRRPAAAPAVEGKPTVFLFSDSQIKEESFLEDINNILSSGVVPNLFPDDLMPPIYEAMRLEAKRAGLPTPPPDRLWDMFVERVRANLHVVLCMSPVGDAFRARCRAFPALVSWCVRPPSCSRSRARVSCARKCERSWRHFARDVAPDRRISARPPAGAPQHHH